MSYSRSTPRNKYLYLYNLSQKDVCINIRYSVCCNLQSIFNSNIMIFFFRSFSLFLSEYLPQLRETERHRSMQKSVAIIIIT